MGPVVAPLSNQIQGNHRLCGSGMERLKQGAGIILTETHSR